MTVLHPLTTPHPAIRMWDVGAGVAAVAWHADDGKLTAAAALADGTLALANGTANPHNDTQNAVKIPLNPQNSQLFTLISVPTGFITAADSGWLHHTSPQGEVTEFVHLKGQFPDHLAYCPSTETVIASAGKFVKLFNNLGELKATLGPFPSTVGGLAVNTKARRLAVSHYNGSTIFDLNAPQKTPPRLLNWKGSHLALTFEPSGKWLISAMQEQSIHLWRLSDGLDLQMRGYPQKISMFSWTSDGNHLATTGGYGIPLWNFSNKIKGPAGSAARVLADTGTDDVFTTAVACHQNGPFMSIGYSNGLILLINIDDEKTIPLKAAGTAPATSLAWSPNGLHLAAGTDDGLFQIVDFSALIGR